MTQQIVKGRYAILDSRETAKLAARVALDKKAQDILVLDISRLLVITDCFIILSGKTSRQTKTISDAIQEELGKRGIKPIGKEGETEAKWILLDYGDVVVHIFRAEEREYYQLERLWKDALEIEWEEDKRKSGEASSPYSDQINA